MNKITQDAREASTKLEAVCKAAKLPTWSYQDVAGSGLQGYVRTSYKAMLVLFGDPSCGRSGDGKVSNEWVIKVGETVATVYDYKGDCSLDGAVCEWHVGGKGRKALELIATLTGWEVVSR
jgi:hypothetical protein